jgi:hypothetical protein
MECIRCAYDIDHWYIVTRKRRGRFKCPKCGQKHKLKGEFELVLWIVGVSVFVLAYPILVLIVYWIGYNIFISIEADDDME